MRCTAGQGDEDVLDGVVEAKHSIVRIFARMTSVFPAAATSR